MAHTNTTFQLPDELAAFAWLRDGVHGPRPLPPMVGDVVAAWFSMVFGRPVIVVNGYVFLGITAPAGSGAVFERAPQADPARAWFDFYVPRVRTVARSLTSRDWDALDVGDIRRELDDCLTAVAGSFSSTMAPLGGLATPMSELIALCSRHFSDGEIRAMTLVQGHENATSAIGERLADLARDASAYPDLARAVRAGDLALLADSDATRTWLEAWGSFLDEFGSGTQTWFQFQEPPWRDEPSVPLSMLARLMDRAADNLTSRERSARQRSELLDETLAALPGDGDRARLQDLLEQNREYVAVIEDRARWQHVLAAVPRAPIMAAGRKLAAAGTIDVPADVFFLRLDELADQSIHPAQTAVAERKAALSEWETLSPPQSLGAELPGGLERVPTMRQQFGLGALPDAGTGVVTGFGAGAGVITGIARIIGDIREGSRMEPGDVLVCRNTAPPWTPLFAIAGAVVTESGGVLSHAGIAAREYAIPAVVGAREATRLIPDGSLVTVNGTSGTVTWEP